MSIPYFSMVTSQRMSVKLPPLAAAQDRELTGGRAYEGSPQLQARIRLALLRSAAGSRLFWQFPVAILIVFGLCTPLFFPTLGTMALLVLILAAVCLAAIMPIRMFVDLRDIAYLYSMPEEQYRAQLGRFALLWKIPHFTFEVPYTDIVSVRSTRGVSIVSIRNSTAVCIIPSELFSLEEIAERLPHE